MEKYWSTDEMLSTPFLRKRFSSIFRFLHFTSDDTRNDKLNKIRPVFINKFRESYRPGSNVTVDKSLMTWLGTSFDLCENGTRYLYNSSIYTGKGTDNTRDSDLRLFDGSISRPGQDNISR
ncbi:PiggyBac transposable element-derived protein 4 [Blattella germanica]|nr:PiggyBac transposable element-derived protein 4 [Blattella germanica]